MSVAAIQEALKNMAGEELAQAQNAILMAPDLDEEDRSAALLLVGQELQLRQNEGLGRKAERFWNRHGEQVGLVAIGALLGIELGD